MRRNALVAAALALGGLAAGAQEPDTTRRVPLDSVLLRARQLVDSGRDADGRRLIDSLLNTLTTDSARYAEALYWRAVLSATAADAERDYRRLLIEAPLTARAEDALLQLAQLELARGDRRGASDHLQRYLLSYPQSPARPRVSVQLVRLLFDLGPQQLARACEALRSARSDVPPSQVELRNQLDAHAPRCAYVEAQPPAVPPADTTRLTPAADSAARGAPPGNAPPAAIAAPAATGPAPAAYYSVQVAAYDSPETASRMVQQLAARGLEARVDGAAAPYRIRVGKYATRADAVKAAADLKAMGHSGFVTLVSPLPPPPR